MKEKIKNFFYFLNKNKIIEMVVYNFVFFLALPYIFLHDELGGLNLYKLTNNTLLYELYFVGFLYVLGLIALLIVNLIYVKTLYNNKPVIKYYHYSLIMFLLLGIIFFIANNRLNEVSWLTNKMPLYGSVKPSLDNIIIPEYNISK